MAEGESSRGSLEGIRVAVTRARPQAYSLIEQIEGLGGIAIGLPLLEIVDAEDGGAGLLEAVSGLKLRDWLVVLSPNGARRIVSVASQPDDSHLAVIAGGTGTVFTDAGWSIDLVPEIASSVGLLEAFNQVEINGRVVIAQAENGRTELAEGLQARGVEVEVVVAYRNVMPPLDDDVAMAAADSDVVVFASPSAVDRYTDNVGSIPAAAVCIGAVTASTATKAGFEVTTCANPTVEAVIEALQQLGRSLP